MPSLFHLPPPMPPTITPSKTSQHIYYPSNIHSHLHHRSQESSQASVRTPPTTMPHSVVYPPHDVRYHHHRPLDLFPSHTTPTSSTVHATSNPSSSTLKTPPQDRHNNPSPSKIVPRSSSPSVAGCHCKKSRCLKLYCPCFAASQFCQDASCRCEDCQNLTRHAKHVEQVRAVVFHKHTALKKALLSSSSKSCDIPHASASATSSSTTLPLLSCKCVRSECLKKYCDCYHQGMYCTESCRCHNCQNANPNCKRASTHLQLIPPTQKQWNLPLPYYWNQTLPPPTPRSMPLHWNSQPPPQPPVREQHVDLQWKSPTILPPSNTTLHHIDTTTPMAHKDKNDEKRIVISSQNDGIRWQSTQKEEPMDNETNEDSRDRKSNNDDNDDDDDDDVDATMLAALAMTQLSGKRKQKTDSDVLWTPASKISKSSSCSGGSESRNPSPVYRASPLVPMDPPSSVMTPAASSLSSFQQPAATETATTLQHRQQNIIQSPMQTPPIYTVYRNHPHSDQYAQHTHPFTMHARNVHNLRSPQQQCYPSMKEIQTMSSNFTSLPRSLSFRKICSKCGKTRAEHGELGFGNKCPYEDCGKCGANLKSHTAIGISMGITCTLTTAQGAVPGSTELYRRKIQNLAERAELQRNLQQQRRHLHHQVVASTVEREL